VLQCLAGGAGDGGTLAKHACTAVHVRTSGERDLSGGVGGAVVGNPHARAGKRVGERCERGSDAVGLVVSRHEDDHVGVGGSVGDAIYCGAPVVASEI